MNEYKYVLKEVEPSLTGGPYYLGKDGEFDTLESDLRFATKFSTLEFAKIEADAYNSWRGKEELVIVKVERIALPETWEPVLHSENYRCKVFNTATSDYEWADVDSLQQKSFIKHEWREVIE